MGAETVFNLSRHKKRPRTYLAIYKTGSTGKARLGCAKCS